MNKFKEFLNKLEKNMNQEAILRLKIVKPNNHELIEEYKKGNIYVQDISLTSKNRNKLRKTNKAENEVIDIMKEEGNLPYLILVNNKPETTLYYFLFVGYDKNDWNLERSELQLYDRGYRNPRVWEIDVGIREDDEPINTMFTRYTKIQINLD